MNAEPLSGGRAAWPKRFSLAVAMALVATQVWIGGPLLSLWIGSWVQTRGGGSLTIQPRSALATLAALFVISVALMKLLRVISDAYDRATGGGPAKRRHDSWMATERKAFPGQPETLTTLERILVLVVTAAAIAFEVWFFFFSTSPIDQRSGRGSAPLARLTPPAAAPAPRRGAGSAARSRALPRGPSGRSRSAR